MNADDLPLAQVLAETAELYETVASLPAVVERAGAKVPSVPGSRMPPGMAEVLDVDEHQRALTELDSWAEFVVHVMLDEGLDGPMPDSTPARLRYAATWCAVVEHHPDVMLRYALQQDAREHLTAMRRLSRRGTRRVHTESACLDVTCRGSYTAVIDGPEVDGDLVCSRCGDRVPRSTWERWGARVEWVTVTHAANMLGLTEVAVRQRAKRGQWRRRGDGRTVRYWTEDVQAGVSSVA